jgi:Na+/citrate or Na+/malate symporter
MPKTWDEWASMIAIVTGCMAFIVWIANIWIIKPMTASLDLLSEKIDNISNHGDLIHDKHEKRLNHHHDQIEHLKYDVKGLKKERGINDEQD